MMIKLAELLSCDLFFLFAKTDFNLMRAAPAEEEQNHKRILKLQRQLSLIGDDDDYDDDDEEGGR